MLPAGFCILWSPTKTQIIKKNEFSNESGHFRSKTYNSLLLVHYQTKKTCDTFLIDFSSYHNEVNIFSYPNTLSRHFILLPALYILNLVLTVFYRQDFPQFLKLDITKNLFQEKFKHEYS